MSRAPKQLAVVLAAIFLLFRGLPNTMPLYSSVTDPATSNTHGNANSYNDQGGEALPPVHWNSSWIGNQWYPAPWTLQQSAFSSYGYRSYSAWEMREYLRDKSLLFIGDSTARRTMMTLWGIVNAKNIQSDVTVGEINSPAVIDVGKKSPATPQDLPDPDRMVLHRAMCLLGLVDMVKDPAMIDPSDGESMNLQQVMGNYTHVIFVLGPWEVMEYNDCGSQFHGRRNLTDDFFRGLERLVSSTPSRKTKFIWRTWGSPGSTSVGAAQARKRHLNAMAHNRYMKHLIHQRDLQQATTAAAITTATTAVAGTSRISYIDWAKAMLPRLFPDSVRIRGDIDAHYGLEARVAFAQMLINHMVEQDRQERHGILPWTFHRGNVEREEREDNMSAPLEPFMNVAPVLSEADRQALQAVRDVFCSYCLYESINTGCTVRLNYLRNKYRVPELEGMLAVMKESPSCNKTATALAATKGVGGTSA